MPTLTEATEVTEATVRATLDKVIEDVETNQRIYGWFSQNTSSLARATRDLTVVIEHRFAAVDKRFEAIDKRFEEVDRRFDAIDRRFEEVDKRFEAVDQRLDGLEQRLDRFETNTNLQFGLVHDSIRKLDARMEQLVAYIVRDELKEKAAGDE